MITAAVTGGIACGKSLACRRLREALPEGRTELFDSDEAVGALFRDPEVLREIGELEGGERIVRRGKLDRARLRKDAFANSAFREKLERILHPRVLERARDFSASLGSATRLLLCEVPLLYEVEFPIERDFDIVVASSRRTQWNRLVREREMKKELADRMIDSQWPIEKKIERGDIVIWNDGSEEALQAQVEHLATRCAPLFN